MNTFLAYIVSPALLIGYIVFLVRALRVEPRHADTAPEREQGWRSAYNYLWVALWFSIMLSAVDHLVR